jgi:CubicO group peptidase (beta-lactamase class C family)
MPPDVRRLAVELMASHGVSGLAVAFQYGDGPVIHLSLGADKSGQPVVADSLFAVASITKLATALVILQFVDRGEIGLDTPLSAFLPEARAARPGVTIRRLLSHTSGLPYDVDMAWVRTAQKVDWNGFARACLTTELREGSGRQVQYSNVGFGLLAVLAERLTRHSFRSILAARVLGPLGIEGYLGSEPARRPMLVDDVRGEWVGTPYEPFTTAFWRSLALPWGGLVITVDGAIRLVRAFRTGHGSIVSDRLLREAVTNQTGDLAGGFAAPLIWGRGYWGLGPDLRDHKNPHWAPASSSPETYGHSGASGALAYLDPSLDLAWAILGTRTADNGWLVRWGPRLGAAIIESLAR